MYEVIIRKSHPVQVGILRKEEREEWQEFYRQRVEELDVGLVVWATNGGKAKGESNGTI